MGREFRLAVASGKGGTGKTTIATNLALALSRRVSANSGGCTAYVDCDVEEPNGHIFLKPSGLSSRDVSIPVPQVDAERCTHCGACGEACRFSAIVSLPKQVLTFPKLCHGCGGCLLACKFGAITEVERPIGVVERGTSGLLAHIQGRLTVGEAMAPPIIRAVVDAIPADCVAVLDAPPGTSCPVITTVSNSDAVLLVTEPTPFGLNDLILAVEMVRAVGVPFGVAINRDGVGSDLVDEYCSQEGIPVVLRVPHDMRIARAYSIGEMALNVLPELGESLLRTFDAMKQMAAAGKSREGKVERPLLEVGEVSRFPSAELRAAGKKRSPKELVTISGKGGTGKTSVCASFSALAPGSTTVDCDVDAADLHLVLAPQEKSQWPFSGSKIAAIAPELCISCGVCHSLCRYDAIVRPTADTPMTGAGYQAYQVDSIACEGCGVCVDHCPERAISAEPVNSGSWFQSVARHGPMVHAKLGIAQENSGKLVSLVRREGKAVAQLNGSGLLLCDGSPGIGCPVIASITGADMILVVTEPTLSGLHDLRRVAELAAQFKIRTGVAINKADINPELAQRIEREANELGLAVLGKIRYDKEVTAAQVAGVSIVEFSEEGAAKDIVALWQKVSEELGLH